MVRKTPESSNPDNARKEINEKKEQNKVNESQKEERKGEKEKYATGIE